MSIHAIRFSPRPTAVAIGVSAAVALSAFSGVIPALADPGDDGFLGTAEDYVRSSPPT